MAKAYYFRPTTEEDILYVAEHMRAGDVAELKAVHGDECSIEAVLREAVQMTQYPETGMAADTDEAVCIRGVSRKSMLSGTGVPWVLGTERMFDFIKPVIREGKIFIAELVKSYQHLENYVDARNLASIRYIKALGFTIHNPEPYGLKNMPFHHFEMGRR